MRKLECKARWSGRHFVKADRWFASTKACSRCGARAAAMPLSVRRWTCGTRGQDHRLDADFAQDLMSAYASGTISAQLFPISGKTQDHVNEPNGRCQKLAVAQQTKGQVAYEQRFHRQ